MGPLDGSVSASYVDGMHWVIRIKILPKDHPRAYCAGDFNLDLISLPFWASREKAKVFSSKAEAFAALKAGHLESNCGVFRVGKKETDQIKLKPTWLRSYDIISDAVEAGVRRGWNRAHKHTDKPDDETVIDSIASHVMGEISERIDWDR